MWTEIAASILLFAYCFLLVASFGLASTTDDEQEEEVNQLTKRLKLFGLVAIPSIAYLEKYYYR